MFYLRIGFLYNKKIEKEFNKSKGDENRWEKDGILIYLNGYWIYELYLLFLLI